MGKFKKGSIDSLMGETYEKYAAVVLDLGIDKTLDYGIQTPFLNKIQAGTRVEVLVRGFLRKGIVLEIKDTKKPKKVLPISKLLSDVPLLKGDLIKLALWMARYYQTPLGKVLKTFLPASIRGDMREKEQQCVRRQKSIEGLRDLCISLRKKSPKQASILEVMLRVKKDILLTELLEKSSASRSSVDGLIKKNILCVSKVQITRSPLADAEYFPTGPKILNAEQQQAFDKIAKSLTDQMYETHLLFGVTGSGKTEVYLQAIQLALDLKKTVAMLVPEIALTTQTIERFRSRFEGKIAILHHRLSQGERYDEWHRIQRGQASIVIGARSAIFSPLQNIGLIIVDEEHEHSYKQGDDMPCYHARDIAVMRGHLNQCCVVLGSATPSIESYYNAEQKKYTLSLLNHRADNATLPEVSIVNMKREFEKKKGYTSFSDLLLTEIKSGYAKGEQSILFLNRRGYHTALICLECQSAISCPHCDVSLTFHLKTNTLACHLCGYLRTPPPKTCPGCHSDATMKFKGVGTEQIEKSLHAIFPDIRTIRIDGDTTRHKGSYDRLFYAFRNQKADVLIGTQMIAKGLHFPAVTLVGVLNSDASLNIPDFRASEHVFQLITQVSGRSGRGQIKGKVIIQTLMPDNFVIDLASKQDFFAFYQKEIQTRKLFNFPPYLHMAKFCFSGKDEKKTHNRANLFYKNLRQSLPVNYEVYPVVTSGYTKVKDNYRFQFLVKGPSMYHLQQCVTKIKEKLFFSKDVRFFIDVDPVFTFF